MKSEHKKIGLMIELAKLGKRLNKENKGKPKNEWISLPLDKALDKITPAWRGYTGGIWTGPDPNLDKADSFSLEVSPKAGAIIVSQYGDRYLIEDCDMKDKVRIVIFPGDKKKSANIKLETKNLFLGGHLGEFTTEWTINENKWTPREPLVKYTLQQLEAALQEGGTFTIPPSNIKQAVIDIPHNYDDDVLPF